MHMFTGALKVVAMDALLTAIVAACGTLSARCQTSTSFSS